MSDFGNPLEPEHIFKRVLWRSTHGVGSALEQSTTWTITGVAAIVGLFVANLNSVSDIVSLGGIRWSLILFAFSILAGAVSKQLGMAVQSGISTMTQVESLLASEAGQQLMNDMQIEPQQLMSEIGEPFVWPLNELMRRAGVRGLHDYLSSDKRMVRMFCFQLYLNAIHALAAIAAIFVLACSIY
jgi:hypothetical protein